MPSDSRMLFRVTYWAEELAGRLGVEAVGDVGGFAVGVTGGGDPGDDLRLVVAGAEDAGPAGSAAAGAAVARW